MPLAPPDASQEDVLAVHGDPRVASMELQSAVPMHAYAVDSKRALTDLDPERETAAAQTTADSEALAPAHPDSAVYKAYITRVRKRAEFVTTVLAASGKKSI